MTKQSSSRLECFRGSAAGKWLLIFQCTSAQVIAQSQVGSSITPVASIGESLGVGRELWPWIPASYALTAGLFVVVTGRFGDVIGHKCMVLLGYVVNALFNLIAPWVPFIPFLVMRALAGIGVAMLMPNSVGILGRTFPAGSFERVVSFAILGALAPGGALTGAAFASLFLERTTFGWLYWTMAIVSVAYAGLGALILPPDELEQQTSIDWTGSTLVLSGLVLFNFAWNQAPVVGWDTVYVYVLLIVAVVLIAAFVFCTIKKGNEAIIPVHMFRNRNVNLVLVALWAGWMSFGIFLYYTASFIRDVRGFHQPLVIVAQMSPLAPGGIFAAMSLIVLLPRLSAHYIFALAMLAFFAGHLIMSLAPIDQTYWAMVFPATILEVFGPDLSFAAGQIILSNAVEREHQGVAGGLVQTIVNYSISIGLGMAGTIEVNVNPPDAPGADEPANLLKGYRGAFYFGACVSFTAFLIVVFFVRVPQQPATPPSASRSASPQPEHASKEV